MVGNNGKWFVKSFLFHKNFICFFAFIYYVFSFESFGI
ncbi:hypothetical protein B4065_2642 [Caldibacillus thermoamylovorans]|nr:hypothetical protein B4065_2642 [Caldibacillus thermoamylovorans]